MIAQDRAPIIQRLLEPPPHLLSSQFLMPQEPDALWDLLVLELRHSELQANLKKASATVGYSISQEILKNRRAATELKNRLGLDGADLLALSHDTPPSLLSLSFGAIDEEPNDTPPAASDDDEFVVSLRGLGLSFATAIAARLEFKLEGTLRSTPMKMSRRTEDWEFIEFTTQRSPQDLGCVTGTQATVLLQMTLQSGRIITRSLVRFACE